MAEVAVHNEIVLLEPLEQASYSWETQMSPIFTGGGYKLTERQEKSIGYTQRTYPAWVILVCILAFPVGLLALLVEKRESRLIVSFDSYGAGTMARISGTAEEKNKRWLDGLAAEMNGRARQAAAAREA